MTIKMLCSLLPLLITIVRYHRISFPVHSVNLQLGNRFAYSNIFSFLTCRATQNSVQIFHPETHYLQRTEQPWKSVADTMWQRHVVNFEDQLWILSPSRPLMKLLPGDLFEHLSEALLALRRLFPLLHWKCVVRTLKNPLSGSQK